VSADPKETMFAAINLVEQMLKTEKLVDVVGTLAMGIAVCADKMGGNYEQRMQFVKLAAATVSEATKLLIKAREREAAHDARS
jgi:hypothetical protein